MDFRELNLAPVVFPTISPSSSKLPAVESIKALENAERSPGTAGSKLRAPYHVLLWFHVRESETSVWGNSKSGKCCATFALRHSVLMHPHRTAMRKSLISWNPNFGWPWWPASNSAAARMYKVAKLKRKVQELFAMFFLKTLPAFFGITFTIYMLALPFTSTV